MAPNTSTRLRQCWRHTTRVLPARRFLPPISWRFPRPYPTAEPARANLKSTDSQPPTQESIRARRNAWARSPGLLHLNTAYTHVDDVIHLHGFFHHERLAVFHTNQVAVEPGDGAQPFSNLLFLGQQAATLTLRAVLRFIAQQSRHARLELAADIHHERWRHIGV